MTVTCPYCNRICSTKRLLVLHKGHDHPERLTESERIAYENAREQEATNLRRYRLKALVVVTFLYFGFLFTYSIIG